MPVNDLETVSMQPQAGAHHTHAIKAADRYHMTQLIAQCVVCEGRGTTTGTLFCMPAHFEQHSRSQGLIQLEGGHCSFKAANAQDLCTSLALHWSLLDYLNSIN